jgi:hypothetical protein
MQSEMDRMGVLPPMERLIWLSLCQNRLENAEFERLLERKIVLLKKKIHCRGESNEDPMNPSFPSLVYLDLGGNQITVKLHK